MSDAERIAVAALLLRHWDPLHIVNLDAVPAAEYLYEADKVVGLLRDGAGIDTLASFLSEAADQLGSPDRNRDRRAAATIMAWHRQRRRCPAP